MCVCMCFAAGRDGEAAWRAEREEQAAGRGGKKKTVTTRMSNFMYL